MIFAAMQGDPILGRKLRQRRKALGLTQVEVATDIDIDRSHLANVEAGRKALGGRALVKAARRLGLSLDFLAAPEGENPHGAAHARNEAEAVILALIRTWTASEVEALMAFLNSRGGRPEKPQLRMRHTVAGFSATHFS